MILNRHRQGLPPWSLEYPHPSPRPSHPMILSFPLLAHPVSNLNHHSFHSILYQNLTILITLRKKGAYMQVDPTTRLLPLATNKQSTTNGTIYYKRGLTRITWKYKPF
jgi:hypothetical protein